MRGVHIRGSLASETRSSVRKGLELSIRTAASRIPYTLNPETPHPAPPSKKKGNLTPAKLKPWGFRGAEL